MALPFALNHINLWLLRDALDTPSGKVQGWSVVDCCIHRDESKAQWEQIFANELEGLPVLRVIVTHMHPDHVGLADWLCTRWKVPLWMSATDYQVARFLSTSALKLGGLQSADFFALHGLNDPEQVDKIKARANYYPTLVPSVPAQFHRMLDSDTVRIGHAPEHIALYCEALGVMIGGDMMLPRISTNVSVYEQEPEADALKLFLDSIDKFNALPSDTLVLPSHGKPFTGMHQRIAQLHDHHRDRLTEVLQACTARPCSAAEVMPVLFTRPLDLHQTTFAMGESIAHLHYLWYEGKLARTMGADGVYRFAP
jgi:glyoxylase-like metal-dependent hydrolase (beta-lactamase superfamily II)